MNKYILCTDGSAKLVGDSIYDSASAFCLFDEKMNIIKKDSEYLKGKLIIMQKCMLFLKELNLLWNSVF